MTLERQNLQEIVQILPFVLVDIKENLYFCTPIIIKAAFGLPKKGAIIVPPKSIGL